MYGAESVEKLREGVRRDLENELQFKRTRVIRNELVKSLLNRVQVDLPESLVLGETKNVVYDIVRENQERGLSQETIDKQKDEIFNVASNSARDRVKAGFILGRIAEVENIKVTEQEMVQHLVYLAQKNNIKPEKMVKQLRERNGFPQIHERILSSKVLDFLQENARIES